MSKFQENFYKGIGTFIATLSKKEILRLNKDPLVCALEYHDPNPPTTEAYELTMFTPG